jgi:hypothetical protein
MMGIPELYLPMERAILSAYLHVPDPHPDDIAQLDPTKPVPPRWNEHRHGIGPQRSEIQLDNLMLENAVARICLQSVADDLPRWASISNGAVTLGRPAVAPRVSSNGLAPVHLLTIPWADSGPGCSWPEAYHVTWLPGYDRCVVTASADGPDTHGYSDQAIGSFERSGAAVERSKGVLAAFWASQQECGQPRWAYLLEEGALDKNAADEIANSVWSAKKSRR